MAWADLADLVNVGVRDVFGVSATYTPAAGPAHAIMAILDAPGTLVEVSGTVPVQTTTPTLDMREADLTPAVAAQGDTVTIGVTTYEVGHVEPDGNGMVRLYLVQQ